MAKNLKLTALASIIVHCTQPTGYRRGGIAHTSGKQTISADALTQQQLEAIENDPRLSVQAVPLDASTAQNPQLDADNMGTNLDAPKLYAQVDYTQAPIELQPVIALMIDAQFAEQPSCAQVAYEAPGESEGKVVKVKVPALTRDLAWQWLQEAAKAGEGE
ncbi:HI1506-related protein [Pseudoalteromonas sp. 2CM41L]|uniref:HI1506-related protein n=1 Tax=Pseudoalteromonas sp. 2CM41L TaxID=2929857 RepID=UPI0020C14A07|nr:HI1506-related protein [Pseudoalteromonas sp. 2CM41L]MCK8106185.1 HI1506-related protein [Pseudoalteromonas sp. 2CM41L]